MQELQELPKAQRIFKEYVNNQVEQLISQSQDLAKKYLNEREALKNKQQDKVSSRWKVEQMVKLLRNMLKIPMNLRQDIPQMQGLNDQQLQEMKEKYEQLLDSYPSFQQQQQQYQQQQDILPQLPQSLEISQNSQASLQSNTKDTLEKSPTILPRGIISRALNFLESVTYLSVLMIFVYRILL